VAERSFFERLIQPKYTLKKPGHWHRNARQFDRRTDNDNHEQLHPLHLIAAKCTCKFLVQYTR